MPGLPPGLVSSGGWTAVAAFPNLSFSNPVVLLAEPRANRLFVCGREGLIYFFDNDPAASTKTLFLDIRSRTQGYDDCGLLGMAFHPEFTGRQNAAISGQLMGLSPHELDAAMPDIEAFAEIGSYFNQPLRVYSSGMQVRLAAVAGVGVHAASTSVHHGRCSALSSSSRRIACSRPSRARWP